MGSQGGMAVAPASACCLFKVALSRKSRQGQRIGGKMQGIAPADATHAAPTESCPPGLCCHSAALLCCVCSPCHSCTSARAAVDWFESPTAPRDDMSWCGPWTAAGRMSGLASGRPLGPLLSPALGPQPCHMLMLNHLRQSGGLPAPPAAEACAPGRTGLTVGGRHGQWVLSHLQKHHEHLPASLLALSAARR